MPHSYPSGTRRPTSTLFARKLSIGSQAPIRIQGRLDLCVGEDSLLAQEALSLIEGGADLLYVRIHEAHHLDVLRRLREGLSTQRITTPLLVDVDASYHLIAQVLPLTDLLRCTVSGSPEQQAAWMKACKKAEIPLQLHVSDQHVPAELWARCGGSSIGLVEMAHTWGKFCHDIGHEELLFSFEASHPRLTTQACREWITRQEELGWSDPLHLESPADHASGEWGRLSSAMHLGSLLMEGSGDSLLFTLQEMPLHEVEASRHLLLALHHFACRGELFPRTPSLCRRRALQGPSFCKWPFTVISIEAHDLHHRDSLFQEIHSSPTDLLSRPVQAIWVTASSSLNPTQLDTLSWIQQQGVGVLLSGITAPLDLGLPAVELQDIAHKPPIGPYALLISDSNTDLWPLLLRFPPQLILFRPTAPRTILTREFASWCQRYHVTAPILLAFDYDAPYHDALMQMGLEAGVLLLDQAADGLCLMGPYGSHLLHRIMNELEICAEMAPDQAP